MKSYRIAKLRQKGVEKPYFIQTHPKFLGIFTLHNMWTDVGYFDGAAKFHIRYFSTQEEAKNYIYDYLLSEKNGDGEPIEEVQRFEIGE